MVLVQLTGSWRWVGEAAESKGPGHRELHSKLLRCRDVCYFSPHGYQVSNEKELKGREIHFASSSGEAQFLVMGKTWRYWLHGGGDLQISSPAHVFLKEETGTGLEAKMGY